MKINYKKIRQDLIDAKIQRVRLPQWNEWAYIKIDYDKDGNLYPWCEMWDINCRGKQIPVALAFQPEGFWEEWKMPKNYEERSDEIYTHQYTLRNIIADNIFIRLEILNLGKEKFTIERIIDNILWNSARDKKGILIMNLENMIERVVEAAEDKQLL